MHDDENKEKEEEYLREAKRIKDKNGETTDRAYRIIMRRLEEIEEGENTEKERNFWLKEWEITQMNEGMFTPASLTWILNLIGSLHNEQRWKQVVSYGEWGLKIVYKAKLQG